MTDDQIRKALSRAWDLGQTYWRQADSEYASDNRKSDETRQKYLSLVDDTLAAHSAGAQPVMTDLCTLRHRIAAAPRRQFESAPRIYTNWLSQDAVLDLIDAEIERIERGEKS